MGPPGAYATSAPGNQLTTNTWDGENRLTRVALPSGTVNSFAYDADGQRVQKLDSTATTNFIWDGQNVVLETEANDTIQVAYTLEPKRYGNLISQSRGGLDSSYLFDALGSTRQLTSDLGVVTDSYLYDSFGNVVSAVGMTVNLFRFLGKRGYYFDVDSGNLHVRARWYTPGLGRFMSIDPLFPQFALQGTIAIGLNAFLYALNDPPNEVDPSGLDVKLQGSGDCTARLKRVYNNVCQRFVNNGGFKPGTKLS
jgi:RHS repeat-associated protein